MSKIEPCPQCGSKAAVKEKGFGRNLGEMTIECIGCGLSLSYKQTTLIALYPNAPTPFADRILIGTDAIKIWNSIPRNAETNDAKENEPLTLDELRKMDGEPVWVEPVDDRWNQDWKCYCVIDGEEAAVPGVEYWAWKLKDYEKTWLAYRHKPKKQKGVQGK